MAILLNDQELAALAGLPLAAACLYVMAIRPRMDLSTGMVGVRYLVSWQAFREALFVEPAPGRTDSGSPHESTLRRLADQLERAGLIKNSSSKSNRQLIFKCLLATTDKSVQNKPDRQPDRQPDRPQHPRKPATAGKTKPATQQPDRQPDKEPDTHPSFGYIDLNTSRRQSEKGDDDDQIESENQPRGLVFNVGSDQLRASALKMVAEFNDHDAQQILDQLTGAMRSSQIRSPLRYLKTTIENFKRGDFTGELAEIEARSRKRQEQEARRSAQDKSKPVCQKNTAAAREALAKAKAITGGRRAVA